jgi:phage host-nuclease inhibitor protein Gam
VTDRLTLTRAFEGAGLKSGDAERIATEIYEAIHDNVATKTDIAALRTEVKTDIAALRTEVKADIAALRTEVKTDIAALRTEVKTDIAALRTEVKTDTAALRTELRELELRLTLRLGAAIAVVAGLLFTALHYWPPHG